MVVGRRERIRPERARYGDVAVEIDSDRAGIALQQSIDQGEHLTIAHRMAERLDVPFLQHDQYDRRSPKRFARAQGEHRSGSIVPQRNAARHLVALIEVSHVVVVGGRDA